MAGDNSTWTFASEPELREFGPVRAIGMSYKGQNKNNEVPALWERFFPRFGEINPPKDLALSFGICRCIPGKTDGTFEYIAARSASPEALVPSGMMEVQIPHGTYAIFPVRNLSEIFQAWNATPGWFSAHPEWQAYCGPGVTCECATHPCFELYPPEFNGTNSFSLLIPVRKK